MIIATLILGTYALTLAATESSGPYGILERIRNVKWVKDFGVLECQLCCSFWVALSLCIAFGRLDLILITWGGSYLLSQLVLAITVR